MAIDQSELVAHPAELGGRIGFWGGIVGAVQAAVVLIALLVADPADAFRFSYPFTPGVYSIAEVTFAAQHVTLIIGVLALAGVVRTSRLGRYGLLGAAVGLALLTLMELFAITVADAAADDPRAELVSSLYGIPTVITGIALVVGGIGIARSGVLAGWSRWIVLATGAFVFVALIPALVGPDIAGRIAIGVWMLLFAALARAAYATR
ncbi:hypothetical protein [Actinomycetospora sp.]|jgi:hypothetical protein|uniref:hypothetical protein n=1 Tax=Actinomycetospora sp. TaxID=1872135 RepID=UPI002F3E95FC